MATDPVSVQHALARLGRALEEATQEAARMDVEAETLRHAAKVAYAKAYLAGEGSIQAREASAIVLTADDDLAARLAEANLRGLVRRITEIRVRVDIGRSLLSASKAEASIAAATP